MSYLISRGNLESSIGNGESTSELLWGDIRSVLYSHVLINGPDQTPELFLHQLCGHHLWQTHNQKKHVNEKTHLQWEITTPPSPTPSLTYMNRHVKVIRFERISHLPKSTQGIISVCLFKAECLVRFAAFLREKMEKELCGRRTLHKAFHTSLPARNVTLQYGDETIFFFILLQILAYLGETLGAPPVSFGDVVQRRDEAEGVVTVVTAVTQQQTVLLSPAATHQTHNQIHLKMRAAVNTGERKCQKQCLKAKEKKCVTFLERFSFCFLVRQLKRDENEDS